MVQHSAAQQEEEKVLSQDDDGVKGGGDLAGNSYGRIFRVRRIFVHRSRCASKKVRGNTQRKRIRGKEGFRHHEFHSLGMFWARHSMNGFGTPECGAMVDLGKDDFMRERFFCRRFLNVWFSLSLFCDGIIFTTSGK